MKQIEILKQLIKEYDEKFRHPSLEKFAFIEPYHFPAINPVCSPLAAKKGVYIIFNKLDQIIYIGKSSAQKKAVWHRIYDHIYSSKKSYWYSDASYFCGWAVPDESFFEATALEEYLIFKLRESLPNNRIGK